MSTKFQYWKKRAGMFCLLLLLVIAGSSIPVMAQSGFQINNNGKAVTSKNALIMQPGNKATLKTSGIKGKVKWSSSNKKVATIASNGKVTALRNGSTTITAKVGNKKTTCKVTVKKLTLNKYSATLNVGKKLTLKCSSSAVKWKSSNTKIAAVSKSGVVTAKKAGTVTIKGTAGKVTVSCKVKVTKAAAISGGTVQYVCNVNSGVFHKATCGSVSRMNPSNRKYTNASRASIIAEGYRPCQNCNP